MFMHLQDTVHDYFLVHLGKILQYRVYVEFITKLSKVARKNMCITYNMS